MAVRLPHHVTLLLNFTDVLPRRQKFDSARGIGKYLCYAKQIDLITNSVFKRSSSYFGLALVISLASRAQVVT